MPNRRRAVLLCGQARTTLAAVGRELRRAGIPLVIQAAPADVGAAQRLWRTGAGARVARVVGGELGGEAASRTLVQTAWKAARGLSAVVVCPALSRAAQEAGGSLDDWDEGVAAGLRAPFFLAKHAGLRLGREGGGRLVFAVAFPGSGPVAQVVRAGLQCLVAALTKALPTGVAVAAVVGASRTPTGGTAAEIARGVGLFLAADHLVSGAILDLGAAPHRG